MANTIVRWNPFRELAAMQSAMDRLFDDWRPYMEEGRVAGNVLAIDAHEDEHAYVISTELPGIKSENINIRQEGDYLLIDAEIPETTVEHQGQRSLIKERRYGRFTRRLRLPQNIDFAKAEANYEDGVLTLTLPKAEAAQPKVLQVKTRAANGSAN